MKARFSTDKTGSFLILHVDDWEFYLEQVEGYQDKIEMVEAIKDACESYLEELSQEIAKETT